MSIWINGRPGTVVDCRDRGLQYGDGLFETMRVRRRRIRLLQLHLDRLAEGCRRLGIEVSAAALEREAAARARQCIDGVLKLILTRGRGVRGYRPTGKERYTRVLSLHALPARRDFAEAGPCAAVSYPAGPQSGSGGTEDPESAGVGHGPGGVAR